MAMLSALPCLVLVLLTLGAAQQPVDPSVLEAVFGTPPPATPGPTTDGGVVTGPAPTPGGVSERTPLDQITIRPTDASTTYVNEEGAPCRCVPYYLCSADTNMTLDDPTITGFGELDIRFRDDDCQESTEKCCTDPADPSTKPKPEPDASRLRGCGYTNPRGLDFTITGGTGGEAQFGEFPWVVALLSANGSCQGAGALINPSVVLTGAHTSFKFRPDELRIRAGEWDTQTDKERLPHQERAVQEIFVHPEFHPKTLYNDVALLRLAEPVRLTDHINVACLPPQGAGFDGERGCVANGWGKDVFGQPGRYAVILKKVLLDMVDNKRCERQLQRTRLGSRFRLHNSFVCAGGEEGKDTCQGDGGAPLACPLGADRYQLAGLVAWGIGCGMRDVPAVYTRLALYRQWIDGALAGWELDTATYVAGH